MQNYSSEKNWLEILNNICSNVFMPAMIALLFLYNTLINTWLNGRIETLQNFLAILIIIVLICNNLKISMHQIVDLVQNNWIIVAYCIVRIISLYLSDFDYSVIRSIFFESFLIICITNDLIVQNRKKYIFLFVGLQITFSVLSLTMYYANNIFGSSYKLFLINWTNFENYKNALLFSNPNSAGIMAGFGLIIAVIFLKENVCNKKFSIIYSIFNLIALVLFGCRSAYIGILVVSLVIFITKILLDKAITKCYIYISLIGAIVATMFVYGIIISDGGINNLELSPMESKLNSLSTGRYLIWKECAFEQKDSFLFGEGSLKLEQQERQEMFNEVTWELKIAAEFGPHNGYIGMISATGILGLIFFLAILIDRIRKCKYIDNYWALILIYIFVINCFESLFILNRFFTCFFMFFILASGAEEEE